MAYDYYKGAKGRTKKSYWRKFIKQLRKKEINYTSKSNQHTKTLYKKGIRFVVTKDGSEEKVN